MKPTAALVESLAVLRHDLGKYVALQTRAAGVDAPVSALREALVADLLHTRRGPDGSVDAPAIWAALRPSVAELEGDADFVAIDAAMAALAAALPGLASAGEEELRRAARAALEVADRCRALHGRIRGGAGG